MGGALLCLYLFVHGYWEITPDNPLKGSTLAAFWMVFWKGPVGVGFWFFMMVSWDTLAQGTTTKAVYVETYACCPLLFPHFSPTRVFFRRTGCAR
mgnify:CR=1 FL=1